ncbi:hypothetical protein JAAARDRAFT_55657 [Jaapia argillacea MUCL 33604]|uniref:Uncharacterized protein n=1 Tax=Jaapia argillacea MUCL 33604 TaxID=933084 RepID=A0A067Q1K7_9AGAM|nr:hypothetical protein JAAARDRAFT_55657 [Jaapia argillacea MUCL 33604]
MPSSTEPTIVNVHTPTSSFAIVHSIEEDSLQSLFDKLSRKSSTDYKGERVGPGWVKYQWNDAIWNLDDDADYTIFTWRQKPTSETPSPLSQPTLHVRNPKAPLPTPPSYQNVSFYLFQPQAHSSSSRPGSPPSRPQSRISSVRSNTSRKAKTKGAGAAESDGIPQFKKDFERFHSENGVRTILGTIGPVQNVRMLLKNGYRHVYISRKFALKHGFIPRDAAPGYYGYGGLINIGKWPITVGRTKTSHAVYLSEESHFDVVLGRSFMETRQIKTNSNDPTDVVCGDTGEKIDCELVILKDGKGQIVTVT